MTIDFGMFPPEINSGRIYAGPGSGPMLVAASAWDDLAAELHSTAASYSSVLSGLTVRWRGPASVTMAAAVAPYAAWIRATADQAEQAAAQARAAAGAYEAAFAATVPPATVAANRAELLALIATNFFGQNTSAIMATQAEYGEMWAQDAAAMYGYAGSSAVAAQVTPFDPPPHIANPAGTAGQATAVAQTAGAAAGQAQTLPQLMSVLPASLQSLAQPGLSAAAGNPSAPASLASSLNTLLGFSTGPVSPLSYFSVVGVPQLLGAQSYLLPQAGVNLAGAAGKVTPSMVGNGALLTGGTQARLLSNGSSISAGSGRAGFVGGLSVPQGWAVSAPAVKSAASVLSETGPAGAAAAVAPQGEGAMLGSTALSSLGGRAMGGTGQTLGRSASSTTGAASGPVNIFIVPACAQ